MIGRGDAWGEAVAAPHDVVAVGSDAELAAYVATGDRRPLRLTGGDLLASLGGPSTAPGVARLTIDVLRVRADDRELIAVAHVVARGRSWWGGAIDAVLNADHLGRWDAAPRAHPGDGRLDAIEVDAAMSRRARWQAWRRLSAGTHVPHPQIRTHQERSVAWVYERPQRLWVDGERRGFVRSLEVRVEPAGAIVYI